MQYHGIRFPLALFLSIALHSGGKAFAADYVITFCDETIIRNTNGKVWVLVSPTDALVRTDTYRLSRVWAIDPPSFPPGARVGTVEQYLWRANSAEEAMQMARRLYESGLTQDVDVPAMLARGRTVLSRAGTPTTLGGMKLVEATGEALGMDLCPSSSGSVFEVVSPHEGASLSKNLEITESVVAGTSRLRRGACALGKAVTPVFIAVEPVFVARAHAETIEEAAEPSRIPANGHPDYAKAYMLYLDFFHGVDGRNGYGHVTSLPFEYQRDILLKAHRFAQYVTAGGGLNTTLTELRTRSPRTISGNASEEEIQRIGAYEAARQIARSPHPFYGKWSDYRVRYQMFPGSNCRRR